MALKFKAKSEDTRNFIKLKAGESIQGVVKGDPYDFRIHWLPKEQRSVLCEGKAACPVCESGEKSSFRFRINFIVKDGEDYTAKILEQGWTSYQALINLQESGYDLEKQLIMINRQGTGLNTSYSIIPSPKGFLTPEVMAKLQSVKLNELGHITEAETEPVDPMKVNENDSDISF
jgi:hypothetical protein